MKIQKMKIPAILGALLLAGTLSAGAQMNSDSLYKEPYRPQYHFSPEKGWIGDPSGFMYYQGKDDETRSLYKSKLELLYA